MKRPELLLFILICALPLSASGAVIHVPADQPSIKDALDIAQAGDIVELAPGVHTTNLVFHPAGVTIRGATGSYEDVTITAGGSAPILSSSGAGETRILEHLTLSQGASSGYGGACSGAQGVFIYRNCRFLENHGIYEGGAIFMVDADLTLVDCLFQGNSSDVDGGAVGLIRGSLHIENCIFESNSSDRNGGAVFSNGGYIDIEYSVFQWNSAHIGGAICDFGLDRPSTLNVSHLTLVENTGEGPGIFYGYQGDRVVEDTIVAFNNGSGSITSDSMRPITLRRCDIYGNLGGDFAGSIYNLEGVDGNFSADPLFYDLEFGILSLRPGTPCSGVDGTLGARPYVAPRTHHVEPGDLLKDVLESSSCGDTILVADGVYPACEIDFPQCVHLLGNVDDPESVVFDAQNQGRILDCYRSSSHTLVMGLTFRNGLSDGNGGAVRIDEGRPVFEHVRFADNVCTWDGGAVYCDQASAHFEHCVFIDNSSNAGGAVYAEWAAPSFMNCTMVGNAAPYGGSLNLKGEPVTIDNTIIAYVPVGVPVRCQYGASATLHCCVMFANSEGSWNNCTAGQNASWDNFSDYPNFCSLQDDDLHLHVDSPCLEHFGCGLIGALGAGCGGVADAPLPGSYALHANDPNPFNPVTTLRFDLPEAAKVSLRIYDLKGRLIAAPTDGETWPAGRHSVQWHGEDTSGRAVASGVYLYRLQTDAYESMRRMLLVR